MRILTVILKRVLQLAVLALLVTSASFLLSSLIPGDFFSAQELDPTIRRQTIDQIRHRYGLDQPLLVQYGRWLGRCVQLDLGDSLFYQRPVRGIVLDALAKTLWMGIPALLLGMLGGIFLGAMHALNRNNFFGLALDLLSTVALALPTLVLGLGALLLAAHTHWFPLGSMGSASLQDPRFLAWFADRIHHLLLPVACLTLPILAYVERIQCAALIDLLNAPYVRAARARGLAQRHIFLHYQLRPSLNPILSTSGPLLGSILSGSLVLEVIFAWPGLGQVTLNALFSRDLSLVIGCVVGSTILLVAGNLLADILLLTLDPRTRVAGGAI
ncbi:MAG: ABC transporter permease [Acidobacteriota bacterium]